MDLGGVLITDQDSKLTRLPVSALGSVLVLATNPSTASKTPRFDNVADGGWLMGVATEFCKNGARRETFPRCVLASDMLT